MTLNPAHDLEVLLPQVLGVLKQCAEGQCQLTDVGKLRELKDLTVNILAASEEGGGEEGSKSKKKGEEEEEDEDEGKKKGNP